jgi:hypothetical protein
MSKLTNFTLAALTLLLISASTTYAQRHLKGQHALGLSVGLVDQIPSMKAFRADNQGYLIRADFTRYTVSEHYWMISLQADRKFYHPPVVGPVVVGMSDPLLSDRYTVSFSYNPVSLHNYRRSFYISPLIGALGGLEIINNDNQQVEQGLLTARSQGTLGILTGLEAEVFLTEQLSLVGNVSERFYLLTDLSKLHSQGSVGLRYSLF